MQITRRTTLKFAAAAALAAPASRLLAAAETADVIIIGAGLAGLEAAHTLADSGAKIIVLEARGRAGGRLYTLDDIPGHPEAGGNGIGSGYARLVDRAKILKIDLVDVRSRTEFQAADTLISLRGESIPTSAWEAHPRNPYTGDLRAKPPWTVSFSALRPFNPLPEAAAWRDPAFASHDISVAKLLTEKGWSTDALDLAFGTNPSYANSAHDLSAMMWFHIFKNAELMSAAGPGTFAIKGGNQRLPDAMARALGDRVRFNTPVRRIADDGSSVTVTAASGQRWRAKKLIVAVPASALRLVQIDPAPPFAQQAGIDTLPYNRVFQAHYIPTRRFWEADGLPTSMWTDTLAGRFIGLRYGENPKEIFSFIAYASGFQADTLDRMDPAAASAAILADLAAIRPASAGALRLAKTISWARDPYAGGAYACWAPGQITAFANEIGKPLGRIHFAGEHTSEVARGMEGAMESGQRAALEVLTA